MVKYFCDECGKEIDQNEHKKHKVTFYEYTKNETAGYRGPSHTYKTLLSIYPCDECYKKLQKQFNIK